MSQPRRGPRSARKLSRVLAIAGLLGLLLGLVALVRGLRSPASGSSGSVTEAGSLGTGLATGSRSAGLDGDDSAPSDDGPLILEGFVLLPDDTPVRGASVRLLSRPTRAARTSIAHRTRVTDDDGHFVFERQWPGEYLLEAQSEDAVSPTVAVHLQESTEPVTLVLLPAAAVIVRVESARDRSPIAGATVKIGIGEPQLGGTDAHQQTETDSDGIAEVRGLGAVSNHPLWVGAPGFAPSYLNLLSAGKPRGRWEVTVSLEPGGRVSGRVVDARGRAIAGAKVGWTLDAPVSREGLTVFNPFVELGRYEVVRSGANGEFALDVAPGNGCVTAEHPRYRIAQTCGIGLQAGRQRSDVRVVLPDGVRLGGVVVRPDGTAVPGAEVLVTQVGWNHMGMFTDDYRLRVVTDEAGRFLFSAVDPMIAAVVAQGEGAASDLVEVDLRAGGGRDDVRVVLGHAGRIDGVVVDAAQQPVPFALVSFHYRPDFARQPTTAGDRPTPARELSHPRSNGAVTCDAEGRFALTALMPGRYGLSVSRPTVTAVPGALAGVTDAEAKTGDRVTLVAASLGSLTGRVVFEDGAPATDVELALAPFAAKLSEHDFQPPTRVTSPDGRFVIEDVPTRRWAIEVRGTEVVTQRLGGAVDVAAGRATDVGTLRVRRGVRRPGIVLTDLRAPAAQATVFVEATPRRVVQLTAGEDGRFEVPPTAAGQSIRVKAEADGAASDWLVVSPATQRIELVVTRGGPGTISGVFQDPGHAADGRVLVLTLVGDGDPDTLKTLAMARTEAGVGSPSRFRPESICCGRCVSAIAPRIPWRSSGATSAPLPS